MKGPTHWSIARPEGHLDAADRGNFPIEEVTMSSGEKHDKSRERRPDEPPVTDQPHRPVRDVHDDPAPNPDDAAEKPPPKTNDDDELHRRSVKRGLGSASSFEALMGGPGRLKMRR
jgi:hypothetical protein